MTAQDTDIAILGAGPAGLTAALAAAPSGQRILIIDEQALPGGQIWRQGPTTASVPARDRRLAMLAQYPNIQWASGTRMIASLKPGHLLLECPTDRAWTVYYKTLVLASGARELLLPFCGWTTPGVTGAGGLQALIKGGTPVYNQDIIIAGSGPLLLAVAHTARQHGARVRAILEQTSSAALLRFTAGLVAHPGKLLEAARFLPLLASTPYQADTHVHAVRKQNERLIVETRTRNGTTEILDCDRVAVGYGLIPTLEPALALGCHTTPQGILVGTDQQTSITGIYAAGECAGIGGVNLALATGRIAGLAASGQDITTALRQAHVARHFAQLMHRSFALGAALRIPPDGDTIFCRCEDVTIAAVASARTWRDAKLHSRCGMGACQGRLCGAAARLYWNWDQGTPRPPIGPARLGSLLLDNDAPNQHGPSCKTTVTPRADRQS